MTSSTPSAPARDELVRAVRAIAEAGAAEALRHFRRSVPIEAKDSAMTFDPVTEGDRAAERLMRTRIEADFPDHGILGEEYGIKEGGSPWRWVLDPIDGTRGFVSGTPTWTTLVGLEHEQRSVIGAIAQPFTGELWLGYPGGCQVFRGGEGTDCRSSGCTRLRDARLATTDPRPHPDGPMSEEEASRFLAIGRLTPVARFGLDAYAYGLLAAGHLDLVIEAGLERYDVAALIPVLRGAGAIVTAWDGGEPDGAGRILAASTPALHAEAQAHLLA